MNLMAVLESPHCTISDGDNVFFSKVSEYKKTFKDKLSIVIIIFDSMTLTKFVDNASWEFYSSFRLRPLTGLPGITENGKYLELLITLFLEAARQF